MRISAVVLAVVALALGAATAAGQHPHPSPPRADPDAPAGAPPHWLPWEPWVLDHWLPYDERRLLALLRIDRRTLWLRLRDDREPLAVLARERGWSAARLARALVPRRGHDSAHHAMLVRRAERTLTQGHLAQHILFHTLHQEALPGAAASVFGVPAATLRALRQRDLAPLEIARLGGRSRRVVERRAVATLRAAARRGVRTGATSRRQAALVLRRQLRQLPRWLAHRRYNGPPHTEDGKLAEPLRPHALAPSISAAGDLLTFEQAQPAIPRAVAEGEIAVLARRPDGGLPGFPAAPVPGSAPCSSYASQLSADGRVAVLETSAGNRTFGKRYGNLAVVHVSLADGLRRIVSPRGAGWTSYAPSVSEDGSRVAFQVARAASGAPRAQVAVRDVPGGRLRVLAGRAEEPALSGDGRRVAVTAGGRVVVHDLRTGARRTVLPRGATEAYEPVLSHRGDLAFTAMTRQGPQVFVLRRGDREPRRLPALGAAAHDPAISPDGGLVAYSVARGLRSRSATGRPRQEVVVARADGAGSAEVVSVAADGRPAGGWSAHAAIAGAGRAVAFTSDAASLDGDADPTERVYVRDRTAGTTTRVSGDPDRSGAVAATCLAGPPVW